MPRGPRPGPLPPLDPEFTFRDGRSAGASRTRLYARDLDRRVYGVRAEAGAFDRLPDRCRMFARRLPAEVLFSHTTAALLMGVPLSLRLERSLEVHASVPAPRRAPHARGIVGHSRRVLEGDVRVTEGIRHSSPERTWLELATVLSTPDLVAAGDHLIHHRARWTTRARLEERLGAGDRITRPRHLRHALELLDERSESRPESLVRVLLERAGLERPEVNSAVVVTTAGPGIRGDFCFRRQRVIVEYQGDHHRSQRQWRADMTRRTRLEADGWHVLEVNADDLKRPAELAARVRSILRRQARLIARESGERGT